MFEQKEDISPSVELGLLFELLLESFGLGHSLTRSWLIVLQYVVSSLTDHDSQ